MEITEIKVFPVQEEKLRAFVSVVFDECFMVNDIKIIQGREGLFISMPSRRKKNGDFKDVAHPLNNDTRRWIEDRILERYGERVGEAERTPRRRLAQRPAAPKAAAPEPVLQVAPEPSGPLEDDPNRSLDEVQERHLSDAFWRVG